MDPRIRENESSYTKNNIQCHQFQLPCSKFIVNHGVVSSILNANPTLLVIPCKNYSVAITVTHQLMFRPKFIHPWQHFITSYRQEKLDQWMKFIHHPRQHFVHLFIRNLIRKVYQGDNTYQMSLNIMFSVGDTYKAYPTRFHFHLGECVCVSSFTPTRIWWATASLETHPQLATWWEAEQQPSNRKGLDVGQASRLCWALE